VQSIIKGLQSINYPSFIHSRVPAGRTEQRPELVEDKDDIIRQRRSIHILK